MPIDATVRTSFQSSSSANNAVRKALTGAVRGAGRGPFEKRGTAIFACTNADSEEVGEALAKLGIALGEHAADLDFATISVVRRPK